MGYVLFDESHGESWTISEEKALQISPERPENFYYGHLVELLEDQLGLVSQAMTSWSTDTLDGAAVLVIAHPCARDVERNVGGDPIFKTEEIEDIRRFVENGGGLLLISEYNNSHWKNNINEVGKQFGIEFNDDTLMVPRQDRDSILVRHFAVMVSSGHPAAEDIFEISYHRGCTLSLTASLGAQPVVSLTSNHVICAASEYGKGRVVAIGDSDIFSLAFLGHSDNASFFCKLMAWLLRKKVKHADKKDIIVLRRGSEIYKLPKGQDLGKVQGNHVFSVGMKNEEVLALVEGLPNPYEEREKFLEECEFRFHELPEPVRRAVIGFKRRGNPFGALLLTKIPLDPDLPPTPASQRPPKEKKTFWSEAWLAMIGQALGDPIGYSMHHDREIFQNVCPIKKEESEQSAHSSKTFLEWHTEQAFHPELPDFVLLLCLRKDHAGEAKTAVASVPSVLAHIPIIIRQILFQPHFRAGIDFSFGATQAGQRKGGPLVSLLYGYGYDPFMKFDLEQMDPVDRDAMYALRVMKDAVKQVYNYVRLKPGDLMIIDNRRAIHARSGFTPKYDGTDRWLQRMYVRRDKTATDEERYRNERIIDTAFTLGI